VCFSFNALYTHKIHSCIIASIADVSDLHKFVTVALHTAAAEGSFASDKLSRLQFVGSGYAPLIYNVRSTATFDCFQKSCEKVWEVLKLSTDLPAQLVSSEHCCKKCIIQSKLYAVSVMSTWLFQCPACGGSIAVRHSLVM
jgi:hypothetical protein